MLTPLCLPRVSKEALRSIIISQRLLGTREIAVFHHTGCGMLTFSTPQLRALVKDADPGNAALQAVDEIDYLPENALKEGLGMVKTLKSSIKTLELGNKLRKDVWLREIERCSHFVARYLLELMYCTACKARARRQP